MEEGKGGPESFDDLLGRVWKKVGDRGSYRAPLFGGGPL